MKYLVHQDIHFNSWWSSRFFKLTNSQAHVNTWSYRLYPSRLHVKLFCKGCTVPLPQWFHQGQHCRLSRKSILVNFPLYLESYIGEISPIFDELQKHMFTKKPVYSAEIGRYALLLRYTSIQLYRISPDHFPFPPLSILHKIRRGTIDAVKWAQTLRNEGRVSVWQNVLTTKSILLVI